MAASTEKAVGWAISTGRREAALRTLSTGEVLTAGEIARACGRSVQNIAHALRELRKAGLVEVVGPDRHSWKHFRITERGLEVAEGLGPGRASAPDGLRLGGFDELELRTVRDAYQLMVSRPVIAHPRETLRVALQRLLSEPRTRNLYVVGDDGRLVGAVPLVRILQSLDSSLQGTGAREVDVNDYSEHLDDSVESHMRRTPTAKLGDSLKVALRRMSEQGLEDIAVVDDDGSLLGELNGYEVLTVALQASAARGRPGSRSAARD